MSEPISKTSPASVPSVPAGTTPASTVAPDQSPGESAGLGVQPTASPVKFGGNPTGRTRKDGLKSGTPEALEADRKKNAERMAAKRAEQRAAEPPPALPSRTVAEQGAVQATIPVVDGAFDTASPGWSADDFKQVAPDTIELLEQWRVQDKIQLAEEGKLTGAVVQQIAKDAAFPVPAKRSLQSSSPAALAKLFNAMKLPVTFKAYISTCPTLFYLVVRDFQQRSEIRKLIELSREQKSEAVSSQSSAKP